MEAAAATAALRLQLLLAASYANVDVVMRH
jgi:hypothetical protein